MAETGRDSDKFMLRFPDGMRERIKLAADANGRSMNAEINARLEASFEVDLVVNTVKNGEVSHTIVFNVSGSADLAETLQKTLDMIKAP